MDYLNEFYGVVTEIFWGTDNDIKEKENDEDKLRRQYFILDTVVESILLNEYNPLYSYEIDYSHIKDKNICIKKIDSITDRTNKKLPNIRKDASKLVPCITIGTFRFKNVIIWEMEYFEDLNMTQVCFHSSAQCYWFFGLAQPADIYLGKFGRVPTSKFGVGDIIDADVRFTDTKGHKQVWLISMSKRIGKGK